MKIHVRFCSEPDTPKNVKMFAPFSPVVFFLQKNVAVACQIFVAQVRVHDNKGYKGDWPHYTFIPGQKGPRPKRKHVRDVEGTSLTVCELVN